MLLGPMTAAGRWRTTNDWSRRSGPPRRGDCVGTAGHSPTRRTAALSHKSAPLALARSWRICSLGFVLEHLENAINEVSDKDWSWYPFLWLRPQKHEAMGLGRMFAIALLFGLPIGLLMSLALAASLPVAPAVSGLPIAVFPLSLFFVASVLVGPMWNRRALREARRLPSRSASEMRQ